MLVTALQTIQRHILDDMNLQQHCCPQHNPKSHIQLLISVKYSLVLHCVAPGDIADIERELHILQFLTSQCSVQVTACGFQSNMVLQYRINEYCCENLKNHSIPNVMTSKRKYRYSKIITFTFSYCEKILKFFTLLVAATHNRKDNITHFRVH